MLESLQNNETDYLAPEIFLLYGVHPQNHTLTGREAEQEKRRKEVVALISSGQISRAMSRVTSHGVASMNDPAVLARQNIQPGGGLSQTRCPRASLLSISGVCVIGSRPCCQDLHLAVEV